MTAEQWGPWVGVAIGAIAFVSGILAYRGKYKSWLVLKSFLFPGWPGLAGLYLGVGIMMAGLSGPVVDAGMPGALLVLWVLVMFASLAIGIVAMFWLPRSMWPQWIKDTADEMRRGEDAYSQAMKPGGSLYGKLGRPRSEWPTEPERPGAGPAVPAGSEDPRSPGAGPVSDAQDEWRRLQ